MIARWISYEILSEDRIVLSVSEAFYRYFEVKWGKAISSPIQGAELLSFTLPRNNVPQLASTTNSLMHLLKLNSLALLAFVLLSTEGVTQEMIDDIRLSTENKMLADMKQLKESGGSLEYAGTNGETPVNAMLFHWILCLV